MTLDEHALAISNLLRTPWEAVGFVRSWHARYRFDGVFYHASVVQTRYVEGFQVVLVGHQLVTDIRSGAAISVRAACVWLGLDEVPEPLDWRHEL